MHVSTDLQRLVEPDTGKPTLLLPASLAADDVLASRLRDLLPGTSVLLPRVVSRFRQVELRAPSSILQRVRLPVSLLEAPWLIAVVDLDRVAKTGPFVLDLLARYVSPFDRLRIVASRERALLVAEVNLARRIDGVVISHTMDGQQVFVTSDDLIAGELAALTLSETVVGGKRSWQTPWEDGVVQRATELELGARFPGDISLMTEDDPASHIVASTLAALHLRMGIAKGRYGAGCSSDPEVASERGE